MSGNAKANGWIDGSLFNINRNQFPLSELQKYAGQWVAWSGDGKRIVASDKSFLGLCDVLNESAIDTSTVVLSEIFADEVGLELVACAEVSP